MKKVKMVATVNTPKNALVKKFENEVKNYLSMTTSYTKYYGFDDDNFKVDANDDYIEIVFHGNRVTFFDSGGVKAYYSENVVDLVKIDIFKDIMSSSGEFWMMYDWVFQTNHSS
jgi:hypothetical protein